MNNERRKALAGISKEITSIKERLEFLRDDEQNSLDNLPENLQCGAKADTMQEKIDSLDTVIDSLQDNLDEIENIVS